MTLTLRWYYNNIADQVTCFSKLVFSYHEISGYNMFHNYLSFAVYHYFDQIYYLNTVKYDKIRYKIVMITMHKLSHAFHVINYYIYHASSHAFSLHKSKWKHNCTNMQMIFFPLVSCMSFFLVWRGGIDFSYI